MSKHAGEWTDEEIAEYQRAYASDEPIELPIHERGECNHCDLLRTWMREVDDASA